VAPPRLVCVRDRGSGTTPPSGCDRHVARRIGQRVSVGESAGPSRGPVGGDPAASWGCAPVRASSVSRPAPGPAWRAPALPAAAGRGCLGASSATLSAVSASGRRPLLRNDGRQMGHNTQRADTLGPRLQCQSQSSALPHPEGSGVAAPALGPLRAVRLRAGLCGLRPRAPVVLATSPALALLSVRSGRQSRCSTAVSHRRCSRARVRLRGLCQTQLFGPGKRTHSVSEFVPKSTEWPWFGQAQSQEPSYRAMTVLQSAFLFSLTRRRFFHGPVRKRRVG
jgi:hypothetical protein